MKKKAYVRILRIIAAVLSILYLVWRAVFTLPFEYGAASMIAGVCLLLAEAVGIFSGIEQLLVDEKSHIPELPNPPMAWYPQVDVLIATHNEPVELLYKTVNGCLLMDYPDKKKVHIYICDDTNRPEMKALAERMGVNYFGVADNKEAKAGNLNYALARTQAPLVATFDADMIPMHHFLMDTVPYFYQQDESCKVGFVQTPQSFYNEDLFQYNLYSENEVPNEQAFFFREVNVLRSKENSVIYAGSNTLIAREALEEVGGIATGLITEDIATGIRIQEKGYRCYATQKTAANGLAPEDMKSLVSQRERWARGCVQTFRKMHILRNKGLSMKQKSSYLCSLLYWYTPFCRLIYIISPILFALFHIYMVDYQMLELFAFWLPYYVFYNMALKAVSGKIRNGRLSNVYDTIMFPFLLIPILLETCGIRKKKFVVTRKDGVHASDKTLKYVMPHLLLAVLSAASIAVCIKHMFYTSGAYYVVILAWLLINLYSILLAVFFCAGRKKSRKEKRVYANIPATLVCEARNITAITEDISESGLSLLIQYPEYVPDERVRIQLKNEHYESEFESELIHVMKVADGWKYAMRITDISEDNRRQLLGFIYDREPSVPAIISNKAGIFHDLSSNIHRRFDRYESNNRKYPRVKLNKKVSSEDGKTVILYDFNYKYMMIKSESGYQKKVTLIVDQTVTLHGILDSEKNGYGLYKVDNVSELADSMLWKEILTQSEQEYEQAYRIMKEEQKRLQRLPQDELNEWEILWTNEA